MMVLRCFPLFALVSLFLINFYNSIYPDEAFAAPSITLSGSATEFADADEFFTDVWGDPKVFDDICDIGFDVFNYAPKGVSNGVWTAVNPETLGPIVGIVPIPTVGTLLAHREDCSKLGLHIPINADKYSLISWKGQSSFPSSLAVLWTKVNNYAIQGMGVFDGYYIPDGGAAIHPAANTWELYQFDLPSNSPAELPWSGNVTGVSVWQSFSLPLGGSTSFDWFRLIDPDSAPTLNVSWVGNSDGQAISGNELVTVYADDNNSGFDGLALNRLLPTSGNINLQLGVLPPGRYYLYAELETHDRTTPTLLARSSYVGPIDINGKPYLNFTAPTRTSGPEYSRDERGDPWDMSEATDVANIVDSSGNPTPSVFRGFHDSSFSNGFFQATSDLDVVGFTVDTQVHLTVPSNKPIDTSLYRYFCTRMQIDPQHLVRDGDAADLNAAGWVARAIWTRNSGASAFGSTKAFEVVERSQTYPDFENGFTTYCIDLWLEDSYESGDRYLSTGLVNLVRFDPLEAMPETRFMIDSAALYADNESNTQGIYSIEWNLADPDNDSVTVSLYYDSDNQGFNGTLITTLTNQQVGSGASSWDTSNVSRGSYYIYAVVSDGLNTNRSYSEVFVNVGGGSGGSSGVNTPCDYNGDGKTDLAVVRGGANAEATWFIRNSQTGLATAQVFGNVNRDLFLGADFDGDSVADVTYTTSLSSAATQWVYNSTSTSTPITNTQGWGVLGDIPVPADIDGDNQTDINIFRPSEGAWYSIRSSLGSISLSWGLWGDVPVPADYDGDTWDDIAIWRPSDGTWWILQSTLGASNAPSDILFRQFGLPGDYPMQGDYDGDGAADLVVWRPSTGHWFVCKSSDSFDCSQADIVQFGLPGDIPVHGDFDGDGIMDKAVWRPSVGMWFVLNSSNGLATSVQFGLFGDIPMCSSMYHQMSRM